MYTDPDAGHRLRHDSCDPNDWGAEMLHYLQRDHDLHFERWRHEQLRRLDEDYRAFRRARFADDFDRWRLEREQRSGRIESPRQPVIAMPLPSAELPDGGGAIAPDAESAGRREAVQRFHEERAAADGPEVREREGL
jgi:hypothetical protein